MNVLAWIALGWTLATSSVALFALLLLSSGAGRRRAIPGAPPAYHRRVSSILLLRPCAGLTPHLPQALASTASVASLNCDVQVQLSVASSLDAAWPALSNAVKALPSSLHPHAVDHEVPSSTPNHKAGQLLAAFLSYYREVNADAFVNVDSDIDLSDVDLAPLVAALSLPDVGAAWCPPFEPDHLARTFADRASVALLGGSLHAFSLLGLLDPNTLVGKVFAVRADALRALPDPHALSHALGEDAAIARALHKKGARTLMVPTPVPSLASGRSWSQVVERYGRWLSVIRAQRPALLLSYPLLLCATPLQVLLALITWSSLGPLTLSITLSTRLLCALIAQRASGRRVGLRAALVDSVLADLLLWAALRRALSRRPIIWRGRALSHGPDGQLRAEPGPGPHRQ